MLTRGYSRFSWAQNFKEFLLGILLAKAKQKFFRAEVLDLVTEGGGLFEIDFFGRIRAFQFPVDVGV
jgi:hypothetical protein